MDQCYSYYADIAKYIQYRTYMTEAQDEEYLNQKPKKTSDAFTLDKEELNKLPPGQMTLQQSKQLKDLLESY